MRSKVLPSKEALLTSPDACSNPAKTDLRLELPFGREDASLMSLLRSDAVSLRVTVFPFVEHPLSSITVGYSATRGSSGPSPRHHETPL